MKKHKLIYYTNIFDDECKKDRQANMISMAASRKILAFYESMSKYSKCFSNESLHIISLGITNYQYNPRIFPQYKSRKHSFIIHYGTFVRFKIIRDIISIFWAVIKTIRIVRRNDFVVFYNWSPHFLVPVFLCRILQAKCILDIEDGPPEKISSPSDLVQYILYYFFSFLCKHGTIIAANSLLRFSKTNKHLVFYSVSKSSNSNKNYLDNIVKIHFGGSLMKETGFHLLRDAIEIINNNKQSKKINFTITGYLDSKSEEYRKLNEFNNVSILGNLSFNEFEKAIKDCTVGLSLKLPGSRFGNTTFPSKVLDITSRGMLLITTDISDIRSIFNESAIYLHEIDPNELANKIISLIDGRKSLMNMALESKEISDRLFSPKRIAKSWDYFLYNLK